VGQGVSRASVRAGVAAFLAPPNVAGLSEVFASLPVVQPGETFFSQPGQSSGASAFVFIEHERERRMSLPAYSANKLVIYTCAVVINFFWVSAGGVGGLGVDPGVQAMQAYDSIVDSLKARIRSDLTMGGTFFSAGDGAELGQDDLQLDSDLAVRIGSDIGIRAALRFTGSEVIQA
jgi:hypothetical protein